MYRSDPHAADDRIRAALAAIAQRERLQHVRAQLAKDVAREEQRAGELAKTMEDEQKDVGRYDRGVWAFLYNIVADREARLSKEQREAAEAEARFREAAGVRDGLRAEIASIDERLAGLATADEQLAAARAAKQVLLVQLGSPAGAELDGIANQLGALDGEAKALDEALEAGHRAVATLTNLAEVLASARSWGTADLLTDSFLVSWTKRNKLDDARAIAGTAQAELTVFQRELADVGMGLEAELVAVADHHRFLDTWFDNIFSDISVQSRIADAQETTSKTLEVVKLHLDVARRRRDELSARVTSLLEQREQLLDPR